MTAQAQFPQTQARPTPIRSLQLLGGAFVAGAVCCLAQLGTPDLVEASSKSAGTGTGVVGRTCDGPAAAEAYNFAGIDSIVDVGGRYGLLLATVLERNTHLKGKLYDMAHIAEGPTNRPLKPMMQRCALGSGDMFSSVPAGADAYILKHIVPAGRTTCTSRYLNRAGKS